ncbi:hypothetical protein [Vineibacter terrae]|uniref:hypothetical protein n=1 Tax=Vineibacter terrae TaxID=2586908 RepID=UPI002E36BCD6|nr:hypothetical protein [Vineibacter terrae]HEX2887984.1 hypothetical protein [Vineibacter terrae]
MSCKINPFYNIEAPVGAGQANRPDDVSLVQYLLVKVASRTMGKWTPPATPLQVNGVYSAALTEWIMSYQKRTKGMNDGVVSPQVNPHWRVSTYGTIVSLNASYRNNFGARRHDNIIAEPDLPATLRMALSATNAKPEMGTMM